MDDAARKMTPLVCEGLILFITHPHFSSGAVPRRYTLHSVLRRPSGDTHTITIDFPAAMNTTKVEILSNRRTARRKRKWRTRYEHSLSGFWRTTPAVRMTGCTWRAMVASRLSSNFQCERRTLGREVAQGHERSDFPSNLFCERRSLGA